MLVEWDVQVLRERRCAGRMYLRHGRVRRARTTEHGGAIHAQSKPVEPHHADEPPEKRRFRHHAQQLI